MKILLYTSHGANICTKEMLDILNKGSFPRNRCGEIIKFVENKAVDMCIKEESDFNAIKEYLKKNLNNIAKIQSSKDADIYCIWDDEISWTRTFSILNVDISRPWTIADYDGSEYIKYLDDYKLKDKEINYYDNN